jgi:4-hydroxyphenylpyruvate dioxygenase-like putative hemolysin
MSSAPARQIVLCAMALVFASLTHPAHAHAAEAEAIAVKYDEVVAAYAADAAAAAAKYEDKRLVFTGVVMRMGSESGGTYFGAVAEDGSRFDTHFQVEHQEALKAKFEGGQVVPFVPSVSLVFECVNEGLVGSAVPGLKLGRCRVTG